MRKAHEAQVHMAWLEEAAGMTRRRVPGCWRASCCLHFAAAQLGDDVFFQCHTRRNEVLGYRCWRHRQSYDVQRYLSVQQQQHYHHHLQQVSHENATTTASSPTTSANARIPASAPITPCCGPAM